MIVAEHLHKKFEDGVVAVHDAHFAVGPGEVFGLLGPNGAGKSTTLHLLLGHIAPTSGRALLAGIDVHAQPLEAKRHVGYVSENVLLYGTLTAKQNLRFFCRVAGVDVSGEGRDEVLARVGLASAASRPVETFSKGMRQRLGIAIAVAKDPAAFVMDEPTTGLDPVGVRELLRITGELKAQGKAVLLVTHDLFRLKDLADRIAVMKDGRLVPAMAADQVPDVEAYYRRIMEGDGTGAEVVARGQARA